MREKILGTILILVFSMLGHLENFRSTTNTHVVTKSDRTHETHYEFNHVIETEYRCCVSCQPCAASQHQQWQHTLHQLNY